MPKMTWITFEQHPEFSCFTLECPVSGSRVDAPSYACQYGVTLRSLDGGDMSSYVDFFFARSPVNSLHWEFVDNDARDDFISMCQEDGCMAELQLIQEGWNDAGEKHQHKQKQNHDAQKAKQRQKRQASAETKSQRMADSMRASLAKLDKDLANPKMQHKWPSLQSKRDRIQAELQRLS